MAKEEHGNGAASKVNDNIDALMLEQRRLFICDGIDQETARDVIRKLWYLEHKDPGKPILLVINSPGGSVHAGFAIWDQVKLISSPVTTLVTGLAASMGSILSLCAKKGRRLATPSATIMIHQPLLSGMIEGQATDLEIQAKEIIKMRNSLVHIYMDATGKTFDEIEKAIDRDTWLTAEEAKEFGLIDRVVHSMDDLK